jgi:two-component system chemotaxis response regulator CheY
MRQMIAMTLKGAGYAVQEATNGQDGVGKATTGKFDLFFVDLNMPVMDGITFIKTVRAMPKYQFTPIIMLTTESQQSKKAEGKAAGATGWIVKPFTVDQLCAVTKKLIG